MLEIHFFYQTLSFPFLRPANLRDFLVRAKLPAVDRRQGAGRGLQPGFKKCGKTRCLCCIYSANSRTHTSTLTNQTWPIKQSITCDDANVVYNITCSHGAGQCLRKPAQYVRKVGSTRPFRNRCTTTWTLEWAATSTILAMTLRTSTFCHLRKFEALTPLLLKQVRVSG